MCEFQDSEGGECRYLYPTTGFDAKTNNVYVYGIPSLRSENVADFGIEGKIAFWRGAHGLGGEVAILARYDPIVFVDLIFGPVSDVSQ